MTTIRLAELVRSALVFSDEFPANFGEPSPGIYAIVLDYLSSGDDDFMLLSAHELNVVARLAKQVQEAAKELE